MATAKEPLVITITGPQGSGKSELTAVLKKHFDLKTEQLVEVIDHPPYERRVSDGVRPDVIIRTETTGAIVLNLDQRLENIASRLEAGGHPLTVEELALIAPLPIADVPYSIKQAYFTSMHQKRASRLEAMSEAPPCTPQQAAADRVRKAIDELNASLTAAMDVGLSIETEGCTVHSTSLPVWQKTKITHTAEL